MIVDCISSASNKMIKYYMVNKMINFIMKIKVFLLNHPSFRNTVSNKIKELQNDLYVIQSAELEFSKEITNTFENCKKFIDDIEKSKIRFDCEYKNQPKSPTFFKEKITANGQEISIIEKGFEY